MNDREELYRNWVGWVTTNLGRDTRLAEIAATAAADVAELGQGFNNAAEAARIAWADSAKQYSNDHRWWWDGHHWTPASQTVPPPAGSTASVIPTKDQGWERSAFIAWIPLTAAWLWPIVTLVLIYRFDLNLARLGVVGVPVVAVIAVELGHSARANIKWTRRRGGSIAMVVLILSYITLIASPILMIGFLIVAVGFPPLVGGF